MANRQYTKVKEEITPARNEFWSSRDIDPSHPSHVMRGELAEYNYYAGLLAGGLDPDLLGQLSEDGTQGDRFAKAQAFAKKNPSFYVPETEYGKYIGEENVARFIDLKNKAEAHYKLDTAGSQEAAGAFGARQYAMSAPRTFYREDPGIDRSYEYKYTPETGVTYGLTDLQMDTTTGGYEAMSNFERDYTPELSNGIDLTARNVKRGTPAPDKLDSLGLPETTIDTKPTLSKVPSAAADITTAGSGAGVPLSAASTLTSAAIDTAEAGNKTKSVGGAVAKGAVSGAAVGSVAGPVGAAAGAVIGGAVSGISQSMANDKIEAAIEKEEHNRYAARVMENIQPAQNTQAPMAEFGVAGAKMNTPVEVERDELVMRKDALGNYKLKADFKNGKRHDQGGEDYVLEEGDIVFPGKKRTTIMNHLKNGNSAALESERLRLPTDLPKENKDVQLKEGINNDKLRPDGTRPKHLDLGKEDDYSFMSEGLLGYFNRGGELPDFEEILKKYGGGYTGYKKYMKEKAAEDKKEKVSSDKDAKVKEWTKAKLKEAQDKTKFGQAGKFGDEDFSDIWGDTQKKDLGNLAFTPQTLEDQARAVGQGTVTGDAIQPNALQPKTPAEKGSGAVPAVSKVPRKVEDLNLAARGLDTVDEVSSNVLAPMGETAVTEAYDPDKDIKDVARAKTMRDGGSSMEDVLNFAPAAANIIRSFQTPETVDRRFVTPDELQYRDMSATARAEIDAAERVERENAARFSGGSAQVARAGKAAATSSRFRRRAAIDTAEMQRADTIAARNVETRNRAEGINIDLANKYDTMDSQNRAAVDAYFDQGIHDFGRISRQNRMDTRAEKQQDIILENIRSNNFGYTGSKVRYLPENEG